MASSSYRFGIELQQVEQSMIDQEVLKECVDGVGNRTPEVEAPTHHSPTLIQLFPNLSYRLPRQGVPNGRLIRIQLWPPPPPRDDYRATVRLESTPSSFRRRFLKFAEDIPSRVRCLRQMQEALIDQPNLVEQERQCIAKIQNRMQARALRNQQFDEEEATVTCERAKREEEKEVLITRLEDIRRNLSYRLPRQGVPNGRLIRIQLWPPPPPRDDYRATVRYIEYTISQLKNGIVSQQMVDSAKETVRRLRSKGYSNLDEDEAITLKDSIHFLGRLESTPSSFRERFLKLAEDIPSGVCCLRQMQETLIDQPNLVEQERQCIAEIQNRMQAHALRNQQFDEEEVTVTCERAKREEEKEVLITRLEDIRRIVTETSTALSYIDGGRI
ncbi:uncharacterized protein LOC121052218 isoform X2 [Rosa chinensis]|uniref:uncharacterized protein LOC121052218 isoform X2 n=1 Tax=Rosa chinensis TaxID=74649 RepID=UPI001AD92C16|nr:uncharacterized protein LOC121052218 isoform X2 [Rosa chinensis]